MNDAQNGGRCKCHRVDGSTRRDFLAVVSILGVDLVFSSATNLVSAEPADERPKEGDVLVPFESEKQIPLEPKDIPFGGPPLFAWPMDLAANVVRSGSRLNKVLLIRLDPATLIGVTQERAADGVVAYSAICPHAGCEVNVWVDDQKTLECSCHYSHYNPREGAAVIDGPTPRALAALPLKSRGRQARGGKTFCRARRHCSDLMRAWRGRAEGVPCTHEMNEPKHTTAATHEKARRK